MAAEYLKQRTKRYALRIIRRVASLPTTRPADGISEHLVRAGTARGAH
jgi:hypothetical protein